MISEYIKNAVGPRRQQTLRWITRTIMKEFPEADSVVVSGVSRLLVGPSVADRTRKNLIVVRKECDRDHSHAWTTVEDEAGAPAERTWVFVDDFVESGAMFERCQVELAERGYGRCVGIVEYAGSGVNKTFKSIRRITR